MRREFDPSHHFPWRTEEMDDIFHCRYHVHHLGEENAPIG
jgi:hypothetical protein